MQKVVPQDNWLESWKYSYRYDLLEIYGDLSSKGYAYAYANRRQQILDLVQKVAQPGATILDVAAAQGNLSLMLAELGYEVTWNDLRLELADYVKMKRERGLIHYVPGNIMTLEFDTCFDLILMGEVIEHVAHPDLFLKKIAQMVKPGGYIIMTTPNGGYFLNKLPKFSEFSDPSQFEAVQFQPNADGHIFLLHLDEVEKLSAEAGLEIRETRLFNNSLTIGHIKLRTALKFLPRQWVDRCEKVTASLPLHLTKKLHHSMIVLLAKLSV